jgi:GT2 family glycosyltransferase
VNNAGVALSGSEYVLLLNDDTLVVEPGWLAEMLGLAMLPGVGVVGTTLLTQDGRIQHAGVWVGLGGYAGHHFAGLAPRTETIFGSTSWYRNLLAVTAACLCVRKELFESVGGFDEEMILAGSDVTLGLDCVARGLRNICSPVPGLHHYESLTRSSATLNDQIVSLLRYQPWHDAGDPYRNARLSQKTPVPTLRSDGETDLVGASRARAGVHL